MNQGFDDLSNNNNTCNTIFIGNSELKISIEHLKQFNNFRNSFQNFDFNEKSNLSSSFDDSIDYKIVLKIYLMEIKSNEKDKKKVKQQYEFHVDANFNSQSKFPIFIGKNNCNILIENDQEISGKHLRIEYTNINKIFSIHDENSKNGTWLLVNDSILLKYKEKENTVFCKDNNESNTTSLNKSKSINKELIKFGDQHVAFELEKT